jgi:hypothetical protein
MKNDMVSKVIYVSSPIPVKILMTFFSEIEKSSIKFKGKHKRPQIAKAILSKKSNTGDITISDFKLYY